LITQFYPSKRPEPIRKVVVYNSSSAAEKATRLGITITEYWRRKSVVSAEAAACPFIVGEKVWPSQLKDLKRHGQVTVMAICRDYDNYGSVDWNDPPFILSVKSEHGHSVQCTWGWCSKTKPEEPEDSLGVC
jgi:hypothetical protein